MSAFMVGDEHIDALLTAGLAHSWTRYGALRWTVRELTEEETSESYEPGEPWGPGASRIYQSVSRELTRETADWVGAMLLAENRRSIDFRYNESELEQPYEYRPLQGTPDPLVVLKAISCLEYQSCEHPGWKTSEAKRFLESLQAKAINQLPGMDDADGWEVHSREVFLTAEAKREVPLRSMAKVVIAARRFVTNGTEAGARELRLAVRAHDDRTAVS